VGRVGLEAADVAHHVEGENLPPPITREFDRTEEPAHGQEEILGRIAVAHNLLARLVQSGYDLKIGRARCEQFANRCGTLRSSARRGNA